MYLFSSFGLSDGADDDLLRGCTACGDLRMACSESGSVSTSVAFGFDVIADIGADVAGDVTVVMAGGIGFDVAGDVGVVMNSIL